VNAVKRVGVLGAGVMGSGIAQVTATAGYETVCYDVDAGALDTGQPPAARWNAAKRGVWRPGHRPPVVSSSPLFCPALGSHSRFPGGAQSLGPL